MSFFFGFVTSETNAFFVDLNTSLILVSFFVEVSPVQMPISVAFSISLIFSFCSNFHFRTPIIESIVSMKNLFVWFNIRKQSAMELYTFAINPLCCIKFIFIFMKVNCAVLQEFNLTKINWHLFQTIFWTPNIHKNIVNLTSIIKNITKIIDFLFSHNIPFKTHKRAITTNSRHHQ